MKTVDPTYLSKLFFISYIMELIFITKRILTLQIWNLSLKKGTWWALFPYHYPKKKKKSNPQILHITFLNLNNRKGLPNKYIYIYLVFWKLFLKVRAKHVWYKNYYLKTIFKFNFLKIVFIFFWKKKKIHLQIKP